MWVLFSTVTGGWDNGAQLNCAQLIYFHLRKQIDCATGEGGLSLETAQKGPQRKTTRRRGEKKTNFTKLCQLRLQLSGCIMFTTAPFTQRTSLL